MAGGFDVSSIWTAGLGTYLLRHPSSAWTLAKSGWRLRRNGWWWHVPFLPLPDRAYWDFRMATLGASLTPAAMVDAAEWSLRQPVGK
jgi:hypothetical protein